MNSTPVPSSRTASIDRPLRSRFSLVTALAGTAVALAGGLGSPAARAEDADRLRYYFGWRSYEADTIWGVDDANGVSVGANFDRHWGMELGVDSLQHNLKNTLSQTVAEQTAITLMPLVRLRQPMMNDRLVPYLIAGVGTSFLQFNDRKSHGFGVDIEAEDWKLAVAGGAGIEYFLTDETAFGFEGKYLWIDELDTRIGGVPGTFDMSSFLLSFGLRMYFDENIPQSFADAVESPCTSRFYFGVRAGVRTILDGNWGGGVKLTPLAQAYGHELNKHYGVTVGATLNRNWGVELAIDGGETSIKVDDKYSIGEYAQAAVIPMLRYRYPLNSGRWVPYAAGGVGMLYAESNDMKPQSALFPGVDSKGFYGVARGGVGMEYFFTRNFSFALETNYQYTWDHEITLPDRPTITGDFSMFQALLMFRAYLFKI